MIYQEFLRVIKFREQNTECFVCGKDGYVHCCDRDDCEYGCIEAKNKQGKKLGKKFGCLTIDYCLTNEGYIINEAKWVICKKCKTYSNVCRKCGEYMRLHYHPGYFQLDGVKSTEKIIFNSNSKKYYPGTNIKYISTLLCMPTGPDGGYIHAWKCSNGECTKYNKIYKYTDK